VPDNITPIFLPSRAPELNPVENVWQYLRQNWLSNTVFDHVHRNARVGARRSAAMTLGIIFSKREFSIVYN
jgi:transposase